MSVLNFLQQFRIKGSGSSHTHVGWHPTLGKFSVPDNELDNFFNVYSSAVEKKETLGLTEVHEKLSPLLIDIDIKVSIDEGYVRKYTNEDIKYIIRLYNEQIRNFFDVSTFKAYIFEKPQPTKSSGKMKDGIHIVYPDIVSEPDIQYKIRENVVNFVKQNELFKHWDATNTMDDIFDKAVIHSAGWVMYGGTKMGFKPYELTGIVNEKLENESSFPPLRERPRLFSIRNHKIETPLSHLGKEHRKNTVKHVKPSVDTTLYRYPVDNEEINIAKKLVGILNPERADDYKSWLDVGFCLFNIDLSLVDEWEQFSRKSSKYTEGECKRLWATFKHGGLGLGSLHRWAKIDDSENYSNIVDEGTRKLLIESLTGTNYDVAKVVHSMYKYQYVCANIKHGMWYEFKGHRWIEMESGIGLKQVLSPVLFRKYRLLESYYTTQMLQVGNDETKIKSLDAKLKACSSLLKKVKDTGFKNKLMSECIELFYDKCFYAKLDSKCHLIGFDNGVYDLENLEFRDGIPEDYISYSTGCEYLPYNPQNNQIQDVNRFTTQVLVDKETREYVLNLLSIFLDGKSYDQKFHIWTGTGANGKSTLVELYGNAFGDYTGSLPVTVLTHKRGSSSSANPEIANLKGKRFAHMQEPEENDKINVGYMKELTGGDKILARALYKQPVEFKPQFDMVLACNQLPPIAAQDNGTWRRLRVVHFSSKFVDEPSAPNEFKKDYTLPDKLGTWHSAIMSILIERYKKVKKNGFVIHEPESVMKYTRDYQKKSDTLLEYVTENLVELEDKKYKLNITNIYSHFKEWYRDEYSEKPPPSKDLKIYLEGKFGKMKATGWSGLAFKSDIDED